MIRYPKPGSEAFRGLALPVLLFAATTIAWISVVREASQMSDMPGMDGMQPSQGLTGFVLAWGVMMTAMMLPSAAPMILFYSKMSRAQRPAEPRVPAELFALTYLVLWMATGIPVYLAGIAIRNATSTASLLQEYAIPVSLLAAGIYQLTPLKQACLRQCQLPANFLMSHWRGGYTGSMRLAAMHAMYCIGCCWALMVILVVAGSMSLQWVLGIAVLVAAEKLLPGKWTAQVIGVVLIGMAALLLLRN